MTVELCSYISHVMITRGQSRHPPGMEYDALRERDTASNSVGMEARTGIGSVLTTVTES